MPGRKPIPIPTKEELEKCYNELKSIILCAEKYGVSHETFRTWLIKNDIPINQRGVNNLPSVLRRKNFSLRRRDSRRF